MAELHGSHPALVNDKILYFAGEINGSKGSKDIYMTTYDRRAHQWKTPTNLNINTRGDELYPYHTEMDFYTSHQMGMWGWVV